ncbi:MAG: ATP-dependent RNA helicase HrpA [Mariprofundales bacterium]
MDRSQTEHTGAMQSSTDRLTARAAAAPVPTFPESLPITAKRQQIAAAIQQHQVVVIAGETGSGKTTQIPKICLELGRGIAGMIGHTQPRRLAARSVATRIAQELKSRVGEHVGYKVRFTDKSNTNSYIKLMTDGILLAEIQGDARLTRYDTIIIDEAHERSLNIDFLLGYLKQLLPQRPDLKIIITSATINTASFSAFFNHAPVIEVSGRGYPVEILYHPILGDEEDRDRDLPQAIVAAVDEVGQMDALGDVLVFLAGEREIREASEALHLHAMPHTEIMPLFSRLSAAEQDRIFQPHRGRRIVLATNVAETSLTVPGIRFVIDSGLARISRYSPRSKVQRLPIEAISQASANQRTGRCGRIAAGVCVRLYSESAFNSRDAHTDPEILRTNLASVILQMANLELGDIAAFPFMHPPEPRAIGDGYRLLHELQAVDSDRTLTPDGKKLVRLPVDPRIGRMLLQADRERSLHEVLIIASALSLQDPRSRPMDAQQQADTKHRIFHDPTSDFISYIKLWNWYHAQSRHLSKNQVRKLCQRHYLSYIRLREWHDLHRQLLGIVRALKMTPNTNKAKPDAIHRALLSGLLGHIAMQDEEKKYLGARGLRLAIFPGSSLFKKPPKWLMAADLVETSRLYARNVATIDPAWLEDLAAHLIKRQYSEPHWSARRAQVNGFERLTLFGLPIVTQRRIDFGGIDAALSRQLFIRHALVLGEYRTHAKFFRHNKALIEALETLEAKSRRRDLMAEEQVIYDFFATIVPENIYSGKRFEQWRQQAENGQPQLLYLSKELLLAQDESSVDTAAFPDGYQVGAQLLSYHYHFDPSHHADGITLIVPKPILPQLQPEPFEWLVKGMLQEKTTLLIKGLPKQLRRSFVPAPQFATAAMQAMEFGQGSLLLALSRQLARMTGVQIPRDSWQTDKLPPHLVMKFRIVDAEGKTVAEGTDLPALQQQFCVDTAVETANSDHSIARDNLKKWDFGTLPEVVVQQTQGLQLQRFPALVDQHHSVAIRLFDHQQQAQAAMRQGVCRLLMLQMKQQVAVLEKQIQQMQPMLLHFSLIGDPATLKQEIIHKAFAVVFLQNPPPRNPVDFEQRFQQGRARLVNKAEQIIQAASKTVLMHETLMRALKNSVATQKKFVADDIRAQCAALVHPHFVRDSDESWLRHVPRFLHAAQIRWEKSGRDLAKDRKNADDIHRFWDIYLQYTDTIPADDARHHELETFRWMIEELRVSLFAQELKASIPISIKRLEKQQQRLQ